MSLWQKLNTLFRASAREPLNALVETNGIRIFEQELQDAEQAISHAKRELACVLAEKNRLQRHNQSLQENMTHREGQARQALALENELLAGELAEVIAEDEQLLKEQQQQLTFLSKQEAYLRKQLKHVVRMVASYHAELRLARANQSAENAMKQLRGYSTGLSSQLNAMESSLGRIRERQQHFRDFDEALSSVESDCNGETLNSKLRNAGISDGKPDAKGVLDRLRSQQGAANPC